MPDMPAAGATGLPGPARPRRNRRRWLRRILLVLGPLVVAVGAGYFYFTGGRYISTENAYVKADKLMVAAEVSGPISEVDVHENQHVAKGEVLFRIDDRPYRIRLQQATANVAAVRDQIAGLKANYREKAEELALARINVSFAKKEYDRQAKLLATRTSSAAKFDAARHALDSARQEVLVAQQQMAQIRAQLAGNPDIPVDRHPQVEEAEAARAAAALDLERTVVRAPFAGTASNVPELGRQVTGNGALSSPVMAIVADRHVWIDANYKETELTHVRPGQPVTVHIDTYPGHEWKGTVQSISPATGAEFAVIPPQNATGNWVKVVQRIPVRISVRTDRGGPVLRAGMSASVEIDTGHSRALPGFVQTALSWVDGTPPARAAEPRTAR